MIPVTTDEARSIAITDRGRVVLSAVRDTDATPDDTHQLFAWDGSGRLVTLTRGVDGELAQS